MSGIDALLEAADQLEQQAFYPETFKTEYLPYEEWQAKIKKANIQSIKEYNAWRDRNRTLVHDSQGGLKRLPSSPAKTYGWTGWQGALLSRAPRRALDVPSYAELQAKVKAAGVRSARQFGVWRSQGNSAPSRPQDTYEDEWGGWGDFLGHYNDRRRLGKKPWLPFKEAQEIVSKLGMPNEKAIFAKLREN